MEQTKVYIKSDYEKILSLIADEAKQSNMLEDMSSTIRQLKAKASFRLALLHQLREKIEQSERNQ